MATKFLDASGLNQYTRALKNGELIVHDASIAFYANYADAEGLIGMIPLKNIPKSALDHLVKVTDKAARLALTIDNVQLGDTVQELDTKLMYLVVDESKLGTEDGFTPYTAGDATHALYADDASTSKEAYHARFTDDASTAKTAQRSLVANDASTADVARRVDWDNIQNTPDEFTPSPHTQDASTITSMSGYEIAQIYTQVNQSDSINEAIGKIEKLASDSSTWDGISGKPSEFAPEDHDASKITSLSTYHRSGISGDVSTGDSLPVALAKIELKAETGGQVECITSETITDIINGSYIPD